MPAQKKLFSLMALLLGAGLLHSGHQAHAALSQGEYLEALKIADQFVQRRKTIAGGANALSTTLVKSLLGRYYQVGDHWEVAAFQSRSNLMRMSALPESNSGRVAVFRYEVTEVRGGTEPEVILRVTQLEQAGVRVADAAVESISLKMNDRLQQGEKTFHMRDGKILGGSLTVPPTQLALFPLDVPEVASAEMTRATQTPELPVQLKGIAQQSGFSPDVARSSWFEQSDFFGRPVQVLWQQGDPWPAYLKTANGVAILLRKGLSHE